MQVVRYMNNIVNVKSFSSPSVVVFKNVYLMNCF